MNWHTLSKDETVKQLKTSHTQGLTNVEAVRRAESCGRNVMDEAPPVNALLLFLAQFRDFMVLILLAATLVSGLLGEYVDALTIMFIVLLNGVLGFFQERKAERSLEALKKYQAHTVTLLRDGRWMDVEAGDVVPGDIVHVKAGTRVCADARMLKASGLYAEEAPLTGESRPVAKIDEDQLDQDAPIAERTTMIYSGTSIVKGEGLAVVTETGMKTEMGRIAHLLQHTEQVLTPLQKRLDHLGKVLVASALLLTLFVVLAGVWQGQDVYQMIFAGVSLAVAAIPEGLPAIVTVALALGVQRMIKEKAIVRRLPAVETLGCASVICSDKTGTLTKNEMSLQRMWCWGTDISAAEIDKGQVPKPAMQLLTTAAAGLEKGGGDPMEEAVTACAARILPDSSAWRVIETYPFDSTRKRAGVLMENETKERMLIVRGAPDILVERSTRVHQGGKEVPLSPMHTMTWQKAVASLADRALRTLAVAYKHVSPGEKPTEDNLVLTGMLGFMDPPRPEAKEAIAECRSAGVKTVMITGDHPKTAAAVARELDMMPPHGRVITGAEWEKLNEAEAKEALRTAYVFSRVTPEHKLELVQGLQQNGHIVAMTGDGVNDAPALKAADIGVAMGKTGTGVAKEAAALILGDDNFATLKQAVKEGRNIYDNIRKFIRYMLASNVGEILVMLFAMLLGLPLPLAAIQILWINLVTDGLPALALGVDRAEKDAMKRGPRAPNESIFARGLGFKVITRGFLIGIVTLIAFVTSLALEPDNLTKAQTIAFATLITAQLIHVFDCRSETSIFSRNPLSNMWLVGAVISSVALMLVVIYAPLLQPIFHTTALPAVDWLLITALAALPTVLFAFPRK
ncbi:Ca2+-transporting ATPase [Salsuginibacillus halophilus]|uniref:Ca2+-transporting ATPase n=1 Tax=Salsuginibacillus halophilus TaxID=517424 RepID=A0A2P8HY56_9BACI|nr:cation-transporting P-type ATPase [Salsuginibacillus halophilus]PSL51095.1 Ca2+-transporting ATPase [Salsuginibacillus halophilus]